LDSDRNSGAPGAAAVVIDAYDVHATTFGAKRPN
jgi:hypothetical protein